MKKSILISIRISEDEEALLNNKCKARGVDRSTYIREKILGENESSGTYSQNVRMALDVISGACVEIREHFQVQMKCVEQLEGGVKLLWQSLR